MELYQIKYFYTLCTMKRFSRAAEALYITPPTLTTAIKRLEASIGHTLVDRSSGEFALTPAGEIFYENAAVILEQVHSLESRLDSLKSESKTLSVIIDHTFCVAGLIDRIGRFAQANSEYHYLVRRRTGSSIRSMIAGGNANLGIILGEEKGSDSIACRAYRSVEYGLYFHSSSNLAQEESIAPALLLQNSVSILNYTGDIVTATQEYFSRFGVTLQNSGVTNVYNEYMTRFIADELGMAILPLQIDFSDPNVIGRPFDPPLMIPHSFIWRKGTPEKKAIRDLMDYLTAPS